MSTGTPGDTVRDRKILKSFIDQEQNGIYTYRRDIKFDMQRIRRVQTQIAAIEKLDD